MRPELKGQAVVLFAESARGLHIVTCSEAASDWGIRPGMPLAEARSLSGHPLVGSKSPATLVTERSDPVEDQEVLQSLAVACQTYSPLVGLEETSVPEALFLDITGCAPHFGGEEALAGQLRDEFVASAYHTRIGVADTVGAAWAVALFKTTAAESITVIPANQHVACLRALPIAGLRLSLFIRETLQKLDLNTIGQIERLPRTTLPARFGKELQQRLDQAWGVVYEFPPPVRLPEPIFAVWNLEDAVTDRGTLELIASDLLTRVLAELPSRRMGVRELQWRFSGRRDAFELTLRLVQATAESRHLESLLRLQWERQDAEFQKSRVTPRCLTEGVTCVRLEIVDAAPLRIQQQTLFDLEPGAKEARAFQQLVERMSSRLGAAAVLQSRTVPDPQPERACEFRTWGESLEGSESSPPSLWEDWLARSRPSRLLASPEPLQVIAAVPDGPPHRLWWKDRQLQITRVWGPERIETGWWRDHDIQRDYYRVETEHGQQLWIFRCLISGQWFWQGAFE
ncbi:MAG: DNA polymerase Y family protein [Planctomycetota bacterium]